MKITFEHKGNKVEWDLPKVNPSRRSDDLRSAGLGCIGLDVGVEDCRDACDILTQALGDEVMIYGHYASPIRVIMATLHDVQENTWTRPAIFQEILDGRQESISDPRRY